MRTKLFLSAAFFFAVLFAAAQVNISPATVITQNFDAMGNSTTLPAGWKMAASTTVPNWATAGTSVSFQASSGSPTTGGTYNWGSSTTERAVGAMTSGTFASPNNLLAAFVNAGATNITDFTVSYDAERYRINSAAASIQFYYSLNGSTWIALNSGDIAAGLFVTGSSAYTYASPFTINRTGITLTGLNIAPGSNLYFRWNINTTGSNSQGIGIDNVVVTALGDIPPPALTAGTITGFGNVCVGSNSTANSFSLSGANLDGSQVTVGPLANYTLSGTANGPWTATLSPFYNGSSFSTTIYVRLSPTGVQFYDGNIPISGGGAAAINLAVTGAGINTAPTAVSGVASSITQVSATINGSTTDNGCTNITTYGIEYSTVNGFANGTGTVATASNLNAGIFSSHLTALTAGTTYYYHAFATNSGGTSYGLQESFTTLPVDPITATAATGITGHGFVANWNAVSGAVNYRLDVATTNTFIHPGTVTLVNWHFPNIADDAIVDVASALNTTKTISAVGTNIPAFNVNGATTSAARATGWDNGNGTKYWQVEINTTGYYNLLLSSKQRSSDTGPKDFKAQYKVGVAGAWVDIPTGTITVANNFTTGLLINKSLPAECNNQASVFIRWIMTSNLQVLSGSVGSTGANLIDDILITGNLTSCLSGYEDLIVNETTKQVTGLSANSNYYYRVRAFDGNTTTINSNIISLTTATEAPVPVKLVSFTAVRSDNKNKIRWETATERNNRGFELQRSIDGISFQTIYFQSAWFPDGNSDERLTYAYNDYDYTGEKQYYRLRQVDFDGKYEFSPVVLVQSRVLNKMLLTLYPNPVHDELNLAIEMPANDKLFIEMVDMNGRVVNSRSTNVSSGKSILHVDVSFLHKGIYLLRVSGKDANVTTSRFIKN